MANAEQIHGQTHNSSPPVKQVQSSLWHLPDPVSRIPNSLALAGPIMVRSYCWTRKTKESLKKPEIRPNLTASRGTLVSGQVDKVMKVF